jgi:flagellar motor switch protein FliG
MTMGKIPHTPERADAGMILDESLKLRKQMSAVEMGGLQKAATLLIALGADACASVFRILSEEETDQLAAEIAKMQYVDSDTASSIIREFCEMISAEEGAIQGGMTYANEALSKAFGSDDSAGKTDHTRTKAGPTALPVSTPDSIESLRKMVMNEHPQTIALILSKVSQDAASEILASLSPDMQVEIIYRIANMTAVSPEIVAQIENSLRERTQHRERPGIGGANAAAEILSCMDADVEKQIMETISNTDPQLADRISELMFTYDDIVTITDTGIQRLIQELDEKDLLMALKASTEPIRAKLFKNMSQRRRETIQEDLESMPPVRLKDALAAQRRILTAVKELSKSGMIEMIREEEQEDYV